MKPLPVVRSVNHDATVGGILVIFEGRSTGREVSER